MPKPFRFKQFTVHHDRCAMKIGTDGILLGAWATGSHARRILDIGTGCGVIALMLAQRFPAAQVAAVELDPAASEQAAANFSESPFRDRLTLTQSSVQDFQVVAPFDLVVSNPTWFPDGPKSPDTKRSLARHNDSLTLNELATEAVRMLSPNGRLSIILPIETAQPFCNLARNVDLHCVRQCRVRSTPDSKPRRMLLEFSNQGGPEELTVQELVVETARHEYSEAYAALAKEFLLKL